MDIIILVLLMLCGGYFVSRDDTRMFGLLSLVLAVMIVVALFGIGGYRFQ